MHAGASGVAIAISLVTGLGCLTARANPIPSGAADQVLPHPAHVPGFSVEANLVTVHALVTDEDGIALRGLKKANFLLLDEGKPQPIANVESSTAPITIVMLLEYSGAAYDYFAYKAASWGSRFLDHLEPKDWIALVTYDLHSKVQVDFTRNRAEVRSSLASLGYPTFRETNLFDALMETMDQLDRVRGRKAILLLTTGANSFSAATLDEVQTRLKGSDVTIFSIGLAEEESIRSAGSSAGYMQARAWLNDFCDLTGGIAFFPRFQAEIPDIFRSVTGFLRSEYTLSFSPAKSAHDGKYHRLEVEVLGLDGKTLTVVNDKGRKRKVSVIARPGYIAPSSKPKPDRGATGRKGAATAR